jgi:hypothetical protein
MPHFPAWLYQAQVFCKNGKSLNHIPHLEISAVAQTLGL